VKNEQEKMLNFFGKTKKLYYFTPDLKLPDFGEESNANH
jgi:hypothetical protein